MSLKDLPPVEIGELSSRYVPLVPG